MTAHDLPVEKMQDTQAYKEDWLGLRTLDEAGKIKIVEYRGPHVQVPDEVWNAHVLPYLIGKQDHDPSGGFRAGYSVISGVFASVLYLGVYLAGK